MLTIDMTCLDPNVSSEKSTVQQEQTTYDIASVSIHFEKGGYCWIVFWVQSGYDFSHESHYSVCHFRKSQVQISNLKRWIKWIRLLFTGCAQQIMRHHHHVPVYVSAVSLLEDVILTMNYP